MIEIQRIVQLQHKTVIRWHEQEIDQPWDDVFGLICRQHAFNFQLWHEEDKARDRTASDAKIAQVKRNIDQLNQQRNDWIEKIDEWIVSDLLERSITAAADARRVTETPGSAIDRLSILSLRLYHLTEQIQREDAAPDVVKSVASKLAVGRQQHNDLALALSDLLSDIYSGRARHHTYRQMKMYNDPQLNPYLYQVRQVKVG